MSDDGVSWDKIRLDLGTLNITGVGAFVRRAEDGGTHRERHLGAEAGAVWGKAKRCQGLVAKQELGNPGKFCLELSDGWGGGGSILLGSSYL